jgi:hypothetical protein
MRKQLLTLSLVELRSNADATLKIHKLFISGDKQYITNLLCKNVQKIATP